MMKYYNNGANVSFFVGETVVSLAKSLVFKISSEKELRNNELIIASICLYYSLFHFALFLVWSFPNFINRKLFNKIIDAHEKGLELPNKDITHKELMNVIENDRFPFNTSKLSEYFKRAFELRGFTNYLGLHMKRILLLSDLAIIIIKM